MAQLPEYIVGIPTAKRLKAQRVALINQYYAKLLKELQAEHRNVKGNNYVVNDFLNAQIFITGDSLKRLATLLLIPGNLLMLLSI